MGTPRDTAPPPVRILPFPDRTSCRVTIRTRGGLPLMGTVSGSRFSPTRLGEMARQCWLSMPLEHPRFGFDMFAVLPDRFVALVRTPPPTSDHDPLRGVVAHYKALVRKAAGVDSNPWALGFEAHAVTTAAGLIRERRDLVAAALMVAGGSG